MCIHIALDRVYCLCRTREQRSVSAQVVWQHSRADIPRNIYINPLASAMTRVVAESAAPHAQHLAQPIVEGHDEYDSVKEHSARVYQSSVSIGRLGVCVYESQLRRASLQPIHTHIVSNCRQNVCIVLLLSR